MRLITFLISIICGVGLMISAPLSYNGCTPESGSEVTSFEDIVLSFDLSGVIEEYGQDEWGICVNSLYSEMSPERNKIAALYKGSVEDGEFLCYLAETIKATKEEFKVGNEIHLRFPNIEVVPGQLYTIYITYDFFAGRKSDKKSWVTATKYSCFANPLTLTFIGASETKKVLLANEWSIEDNASLDAISSVNVKFNYDVALVGTPTVNLNEGSYTMVSTSDISVDPNDPKSLVINFPETKLYNGHNYNIVLPAGAVCVAGESEIVNEEVSLSVTGSGYRYFGTGRVSPANGSTNILDEIYIPFKFPKIEGADFSYGFVNVSGATYPLKCYKGNVTLEQAKEKNPDHIIIEKDMDNSSLKYGVNFALEAGQEYTFIMDEGAVKAYAIGDPRNSYLKDYISEAVELHYTTPTLESLPELVLPKSDIEEGASLESIETVTLANAYYVYNDTHYVLAVSPDVSYKTSGVLYEVLTDGSEREIKRFQASKNGKDAIDLQVNEPLYQGKTYRIVIPEGTFIPFQSNFLKQFVGNKEYSITVTGAKSTESASEFTSSLIEGQKLSHVSVVSFYTAGDVKATDNAKLEIRNGEETVASAPVRVAKEEGYTHVYADFSGEGHQPFATEKGVNYSAVLPQGAVAETANENLLNKEYSVPFTGMASDPVYHNVTLSIDNAVAQTSTVEEGKTVSFKLTPVDDLWTVESVSNATLDEASGMYVTEPVKADTEVKATFALVNPVDFDFTTGVREVPAGCAYSVRSEGEMLIIEGVTAGDNIRIYTTGGTLIADKTVPADMSVAAMNLAPGIYIVAINNTTLKIRH